MPSWAKEIGTCIMSKPPEAKPREPTLHATLILPIGPLCRARYTTIGDLSGWTSGRAVSTQPRELLNLRCRC